MPRRGAGRSTLWDAERKALNGQSNTSNAKDALRIHNEIQAITAKFEPAEERWLELQAELEEMG